MSLALATIAFASTSGPGPTVRAADVNIFPILIAIYVIYSIFSAMGKAAKQAKEAANAPPASATSSPQTQQAQAGQTVTQQATTDQLRAVIALRRAAQVAAQAQRTARVPVQTMTPVPVAQPITSTARPSVSAFDSLLMPAAAPAATFPEPGDGGVNIATLLASLPPAAQAVVASAVIGPCAAHRGGGHVPEDW